MSSRTRLTLALILAAAVAALEFWGGYASHSLALLTDAVHVCMDVFALAVALFAAIGAMRPADSRATGCSRTGIPPTAGTRAEPRSANYCRALIGTTDAALPERI